MGCSFSGLNALYEVVSGGGDFWINERRFKSLRLLGEGGFAYVYLVKEQPGERPGKQPKESAHVAEDGLYALKKVVIQTDEQLELVKKEIQVSSLFNHPILLPLIEYSIIAVKGPQEGMWNQEAYLLFPVHLDGTLLDVLTTMQAKKEFFSALTVLHILRQVAIRLWIGAKVAIGLCIGAIDYMPIASHFGCSMICAGLRHMHTFDLPYAHNDLKPGNILLSYRKNQPPLAVIMDFGSADPARRSIRSRSEALNLQEWAAEHCSAPYRAPELWDCPSHTDINERADIWSLGCTLYAMMYGVSPFEYCLGESGGSLQLAAMNAHIKWPEGPNPPYPESLHQFVTWMLQPQVELRPNIEDVTIHVDKLLAKFPSGALDCARRSN